MPYLKKVEMFFKVKHSQALFFINFRIVVILEQTFFCAITPELRPLYAEKAHQLLNENGTLAGVLFRFPLTEKGPPFGGNKKEYERLFKRKFKIKVLEECYNSIKPRQNNELFIIIKK